MPTVAALGTSFNLPNYHGRVHPLTPSDTPFTTALMGQSGGGEVDPARTFEWQTTDLRDAAQNTVVDGDRVGTGEHRSRSNVFNVLQTHREDVDVAYERLSAIGQFDGRNIAGDNPIVNEEAFQITQMWKQIKRDIEFSLINGTYNLPTTNAAASKTRGLIAAVTTNVFGNTGTPRDLTTGLLLDAMQSAWDNGGLQESAMGLVMVNSRQKRWLTSVYITGQNLEPESRSVGGANVQVIETDFGPLGVMLNRYVPQDVVVITSLDQCKLHFRNVPGKGVMFAEPVAKAGASNATQLYTSVGLEYGNEASHAVISDLAAGNPA